jgi:hypothetical protein
VLTGPRRRGYAAPPLTPIEAAPQWQPPQGHARRRRA